MNDKYFQISELEAFIGSEHLCDYDLTAIIQESTYVDFDDPDKNRYWRDDIDLAEVCARHDLTAGEADMLDVKEAAELLDVSRQRVHQLIQAGQLEGRKIGKTWYIYRHSIENRKGASR